MNTKHFSKIIVFFALAALLLSACSQDKNEGKIKIVTSNSIIYDMTKSIAGDHADVINIVPIGHDPHDYEVKPKDIKAITDADVVLFNGLNLETSSGWFQKALQQGDKKLEDDNVIAVSDGVKKIFLNERHDDNAIDPHAWLSIDNGILYSKNIARALERADKKHSKAYRHNMEQYTKRLTALSGQYKDKFNDIPKSKRHLITSEGAFKYFSRDYELSHAYIWEINTEKQGTPEQLKQAINFVKNHDIKSLFVETSVDKRSMQSLSEMTKTPIYGEVYTDSIGQKGTDGDSYYKMMEHNIKTIHNGLK